MVFEPLFHRRPLVQNGPAYLDVSGPSPVNTIAGQGTTMLSKQLCEIIDCVIFGFRGLIRKRRNSHKFLSSLNDQAENEHL